MREQEREDLQSFEEMQSSPGNRNRSPYSRSWKTRKKLDPDNRFISESYSYFVDEDPEDVN